MKTKPIILVAVLLGVAAFLGIDAYETMIVERVKEYLARPGAGVQAGAEEMRYSFWSGQFSCRDFYYRENGPGRVGCELEAASLSVQGLELKALLSSDIGQLAERAEISALTLRRGEEEIKMDFLALEGVRGPFGRAREAADQPNWPREEREKLLAQFSLDGLLAQGITVRESGTYPGPLLPFRPDTLTIEEISSRGLSTREAQDVSLQTVSFSALGQAILTMNSLRADYARQANADLSLDLDIKDLQLNLHAPGAGPGAFLLQDALGSENLELDLALTSRLEEEQFFPSRLELNLKNMARLEAELWLRGLAGPELKLRQADIVYNDQGLLETYLRYRGGGTPEETEKARQVLLMELDNLASAYGYIPLVRELAAGLGDFILKPGILRLHLVPAQPLNWRELGLTLMLAPASLEFSVVNEGR
jgi:hypothetical protein